MLKLGSYWRARSHAIDPKTIRDRDSMRRLARSIAVSRWTCLLLAGAAAAAAWNVLQIGISRVRPTSLAFICSLLSFALSFYAGRRSLKLAHDYLTRDVDLLVMEQSALSGVGQGAGRVTAELAGLRRGLDRQVFAARCWQYWQAFSLIAGLACYASWEIL